MSGNSLELSYIAAIQNPKAGIDELDRLDAEESLGDFIRQAWRYVDTSDYTHGWHIDAICEALEAVLDGSCKRLLINIPPRHMKSLSVSVMMPAWDWGPKNRPGTRFLFASYAQSLSIRDSVKCRRVLDSVWYRRAWGDRFDLTSDQNTKTRFDNDAGGYRLATSVDGALTGEGGDIIVIDDPHNVREAGSETTRNSTIEWWDEAMSTRLNDPKTGAYVIIMQRVHENDLAGHILAREHGWEHVCLPARYEPDHPHVWPADRRTEPGELLWPERFDEEVISDLETRLGSYAAAGQLQQRPAPREGGYFQRDWFEIVGAAPADAKRVRYWDLAATEETVKSDPDWSVGVKLAMKDGVCWIEDLVRLRGSPKKVQDTVRVTAAIDGIHMPVWIEQEPGSSGKAQIDHFARTVLVGFPFRGDKKTGSKEAMADPVSAAAEAGNLKLVRGHWNMAYIDELEAFPNGSHDDQVDATSGGYAKLAQPLYSGPGMW